METAPTILTIQHEDACPPGWLGEAWVTGGARLEVRRPYRDDEALPDDLGGYSALVVLGGGMGAHDDAEHDWLAPTKDLLRDAVSAGLPTLGVCLGHQLLAVALGGRAGHNPAGRACGRTPIELTPDGADDRLLGGLSGRHIIQWNDDVVTEMPYAAKVLASAPDGSVQAARFSDTAWGLQFHPEAGPAIFDGWVAEKQVATPGASATAAADIRAHSAELRVMGDVLGGRFLSVLADQPVPRVG